LAGGAGHLDPVEHGPPAGEVVDLVDVVGRPVGGQGGGEVDSQKLDPVVLARGAVRLTEVLGAAPGAQSATGQPQASAALRRAADLASTTAAPDGSWARVADAMATRAALPDAMLTAAQIRTAGQADATVRSACAAIGDASTSAARPLSVAQPLNANTATAWTYFIGNTSLTAVQVAGLAGNLQYESGGGLNPAVVQAGCTGTCGVGIAQWTRPGSRYDGLLNLAQREGVAWNTLPVQLHFVWQELTGTPGYGLAALKACTTTDCATRVVMQNYERPANQSTTCSTTSQPSYCVRLADANAMLAAYSHGTAPAATQVVRNPAGAGYWLLSDQGGVYSYGCAPFFGSAAGQPYFAGQRAVGMVATPSGSGYWIVSAAGGVYSYGSAQSYGSAAGQSYFAGQRAVGMATNAAGNGYWIVSAAGGVYSYGGARSYGAAAGQPYFAGQTAVGMASDAAGDGYWIVSAAGGLYAYGAAPSYGAAAGQAYFAGQRAVGMARNSTGTGYWIVSAAGGVYSYGSAPSYGAAAGQAYFTGKTAGGLASTSDGRGYWLVSTDGGVYAFGDAAYAGGGV
jgi:hypothetical protein